MASIFGLILSGVHLTLALFLLSAHSRNRVAMSRIWFLAAAAYAAFALYAYTLVFPLLVAEVFMALDLFLFDGRLISFGTGSSSSGLTREKAVSKAIRSALLWTIPAALVLSFSSGMAALALFVIAAPFAYQIRFRTLLRERVR
ncbi:MAG: hypothetical protein JSS83_12200 [Cyanobacteria bacterium SZAS LIN-3]|nr:hypothetical protein [Cyanobacteria bacterium SZAS LIN-3]